MRQPHVSSLLSLLAMVSTLGACGAPPDAPTPDAPEAVQTASAELATCGGALGVTGVTASVFQDGNPAAQAVDGDLATRWSGQGVGAFITVDLGKLRQVCGVNVAWYQGDTRTNTFTIGVSTDGTNFTQVYSGTSSLGTALQTYAVTSRTARYVRLTFNGNTLNDWASINELQVTGTASGFLHPGVLVSRGQLDFVRGRIAANAEPWTSMVNRAKASRFGSLTYVAGPVAEMRCGSGSNGNDVGCTRARDDALAAYTQALLWQYTGNRAYATNAIAILNAWSSTLQIIHFNANDPSLSNGVLQAAWMGELLPRSAEILRYTDSGWASADVQRFSNMLTNILLPHVVNGWKWGNGNWDLSMANATLSIGVFTDNRTTFDKGISLWRARVPAYLYLTTDGSLPVAPPGYTTRDALIALWHGQTTFVDGLAQETCRDFPHTQMGLASILDVAETARIQGLNLYAEQQRRITAALEFHAYYLNRKQTQVESWLCGGTLTLQDFPTWEIGYNQYATRAGLALPHTAALISRIRQAGPYYTNLQLSWESLTHAGIGSVGLP